MSEFSSSHVKKKARYLLDKNATSFIDLLKTVQFFTEELPKPVDHKNILKSEQTSSVAKRKYTYFKRRHKSTQICLISYLVHLISNF